MTAPAGDSAVTLAVPPKTFTLTTTAQVERTYTVQAKDEDQAKTRLHIHLKDADALAPGIIAQGKQTDATPQRIKTAAKS